MWWSQLVGCRSVTHCTISSSFFFFSPSLRSDSVSYSSNCPQHISLDVVFSDQMYFHLNKRRLLAMSCLCLCIKLSSCSAPPPPPPHTVAESHRGLHPQRGAAPPTSGQLQGCQSESQKASAALIHALLPHQGQGPLGWGRPEGGRAGEEGVQGRVQRGGLTPPGGYWLWRPTRLLGGLEQRSGGSRWGPAGGRRLFPLLRLHLLPQQFLPYHLLCSSFTFAPHPSSFTKQPRPDTVVPAGGAGERGVRWAHIDWSNWSPLTRRWSCYCEWDGGERGVIQLSAVSPCGFWKLVELGLFLFLLLQKSSHSFFHSISQVPSCVFWTANRETCSLWSVITVCSVLLWNQFIN